MLRSFSHGRDQQPRFFVIKYIAACLFAECGRIAECVQIIVLKLECDAEIHGIVVDGLERLLPGIGHHGTQKLPQVLGLFNSTAMQIYEGQQMDMDFERRNDVTVPEYLEMIRPPWCNV